MATLSNRVFYESGNSGASAVVGFADQQNRVVRYNLDLASGEQASHINVVFVGTPYDICIEFKYGDPGVSALNEEMSCYFAISTDPNAFANAGYTEKNTATGKAIFTKVAEYGAEKYEVSCDADVMLYPDTQYYLWIFPGFSNATIGDSNNTWGWFEWNNTPINVVLSGSIPTYTIIYNANGGSGAPAAQTKTQGVTLILSSTQPTRNGYLFKGWSNTQSGMAIYQPSSSYTANASVTLYAVWQDVNLASYNCRACVMYGGSVQMCNAVVRYGGSDKKCRPTINHKNF